jgi:hypothetical protein
MFMIGVFIGVVIFFSLLFWYADKCHKELVMKHPNQ